MRTAAWLTIGVFGLGLMACGAAPPRWYEGDRKTWTVPLADPSAPGLVVEATVQGQGPYRFLLDPDSPKSVIDDGVAKQLGLYSDHRFVRVVNQNDVTVPRKLYEVLALDAGELQVRNIKMLNAPAGSLSAGGRTLHGIIGSDLLSRSIVVHVDRDRGLVRLALTGNQSIPAGAVPVKGWLHYGSLYVPARVDGRKVTLQVRLASGVSTLRGDMLGKLDMPSFGGYAVHVDETGTRTRLPAGGVAPAVGLDGLAVPQVEFFRHGDKRYQGDVLYDGVLGENVLSRFEVVVDRDKEILWLAPRTRS